MITIETMVGFVLQFRGNDKAFCGYTIEQIAGTLTRACDEHTILIATAPNSEVITGIVHWIVFQEQQYIHIQNCLTNGSKGVLPQFLNKFNEVYGPKWSIQGMRYGRVKKYGDSVKFTNRIKLFNKQ